MSPTLRRAAAAPPSQRRKAAGGVDERPVVLDSSCWLEFFVGTDRADLYAARIDAVESLIVPVLTVYEVVKKLAREAGEGTALAALSLMQRGRLVPVDLNMAVAAAVGAACRSLPMADSLIYATARTHDAVLWTQDAHFEGLDGVRYLPIAARRAKA